MTTQKQIIANRKNGRKSTGPKTVKGKARSSKNAFKHGLLSQTIVLPSENTRELNGFRKAMIEDMAPKGAQQAFFADLFVALICRLHSVYQARAELFVAAIKLKRIKIESERQQFQDIAENKQQGNVENSEEIAKFLTAMWKAKPEPTYEEFRTPLLEQLAAREGVDELLRRYEVQYERSMYKAHETFERLQAATTG